MTTVIDLKDQIEVATITRGTRGFKHKKLIYLRNPILNRVAVK